MITNTNFLKKYCIDYKNIENYQEAVKSPLKYDLHHRREISENKSKSDLIEENLYYNRPATELIFIEAGEHIRLHNANRSEETRRKISENNCRYWKGKHPSAETRQKISDSRKGQHWHLENGHRIWTE